MKAYQRPDGRFDYTYTNEQGYVFPAGYCTGYDAVNYAGDKERYHLTGHKTIEEAVACYKQWLLDADLMLCYEEAGDSGKRPCQYPGCNRYLYTYAWIGGKTFELCPKHLNKESISEIFSVD